MRIPLVVLVALASAQCAAAQSRDQVPIIGRPCEGCEAVFDGIPAQVPHVATLARTTEPGERMVITGTVYDPRGRPAPDVVVYAYHTNDAGIYPPDPGMRGTSAYRHGRLRGWARTDALGRYRFETIRPGTYPQRDAPAHVHMHIIEPDCCTYYIDAIHFTDDPLLSDADRAASASAQGGSGVVQPVKGVDGVWQVTRDVHLGRNVPGYARHE